MYHLIYPPASVSVSVSVYITDFGKPGLTQTVGMSRQSGRHDNKTLKEVGAKEHNDSEELEVDQERDGGTLFIYSVS